MSVLITPREDRKGRRRVQIVCSEESRTEQSHAQRLNINEIIRKANLGAMVPAPVGEPVYGDFSSGMDFQKQMNLVLDAQKDFMRLPAEVRREFDNDPAKAIDFLSDPGNEGRARELGMLPPRDVQVQPVQADVNESGSGDSEGSPGSAPE